MIFTSSNAENAAAVGLPVQAELLRQRDGADKTVFFPENSRKPRETMVFRCGSPDGIYEFLVLVGTDGQRGAYGSDTKPHRRPGRSFELKSEADGTPPAPLRFFSEGK
jgi:hypothetical protein